MKGIQYLIAGLSLLAPVLTRADVSEPCFNGVCSFSFEPTKSEMGGSIVLSGSPNSISDITPAAGWDILDCSPTLSSQTIRLVCTGEDSDCEHVFSNGAENTIVRLPADCGKGPFAVVGKAATSNDQSVPPNVLQKARKHSRRSTNAMAVQELSLHTNFTTVKSSQHGNVTFSIVGTTVPGLLQNIDVSHDTRVSSVIDAFKNATDAFSVSQEDGIPTVTSNSSGVIVDDSFSCDNFEASIFSQLQFDLTYEMSIVIIASGTLSPPSVQTFEVISDVSMSLNLESIIQSNVAGSFGNSALTILESFPVPSFNIDGIIEIQSTFTIDTIGNYEFDVFQANQFSYPINIQGGLFIYPPSAGASSATVVKGPADALLITVPNQNINAFSLVQLLPSLNMGVDVINVASANVQFMFENFISTDLIFSSTGDPQAFDGCFSILTVLDVIGLADSDLGGALPAVGVAMFSDISRPIVECFGGSTVIPFPTDKRSIDHDLGARDIPVNRTRLSKRDFTCPVSDLSHDAIQIFSETSIPI